MIDTKPIYACNIFRVLGCISFIIVVIFGNFQIGQLQFLGIALTYYRVGIPILFIIIFLINKRSHINSRLDDKFVKYKNLLIAIVIFWAVYGLISLLISPWSDFNAGAKEILSIGLGCLSAYIGAYLCQYELFDVAVITIKVSVIVLLIIGYIEIFTGYHLPVSRWTNAEFLEALAATYQNGEIPNELFYKATGIFFNENDFCTFLSIFSPAFLYSTKTKWGESIIIKIGNYVVLAGILCVFQVNDAWFCLIASILGMAFYLCIARAKIIKWILVGIVIIVTRIFGVVFFTGMTVWLYRLTGSDIFDHITTYTKSETVLATQIQGVEQDSGSLFLRLNTYIESMNAMFTQSKGLGLGAGSFQNYFTATFEEKNMMSNPHSFWIEILSQYGVIIFLLFVGILLLIFFELLQKGYKAKNSGVAVVLSMGVCFGFASFAPSSFLNMTYYWIPIGLAVGLLILRDQKER